MTDYPPTQLPFHTWSLREIRDPVLTGPGSGVLEAAAAVYTALAETLEKATDDLSAVLRAAQAGHEGAAADASARHIIQLAAAGQTGAAQARLAAMALEDQAAFHTRVRIDMAALTDVAGPQDRASVHGPRAEEARVVAVDAAERYQSNTNHNLTTTFQAFEPPVTPVPDVRTGPAPSGPLWSAGGGGPVGPPSAVPPVAPAAGGTPLDAGSPGAASATGGAGTGGGGVASGAGTGAIAPPITPAPSVAPSGASARGGPREPESRLPPGRAAAGTVAPHIVPPGPVPGPGVTGPALGARWPVDGSRPGGRTGDPRPAASAGEGSSGGSGALRGGGPTAPRPLGGPGPAGEPAPARGTGPAPRTTAGHPGVPMIPPGAVGRGDGAEHSRPSWLVEDDPERIWLADLPPHTIGVIGGEPADADD
ncbi:PPE domain-containing protein [Pseudonocardia hispaniensis]|uniref:PPE domain-containing protein n=1 Tax=Pseudonocardia hispaniensis TaxID=904933 RepID=A0ABW1J8T6_9PSEU